MIFNLDGHFIHDLRVTVIEKWHKTDKATREVRESMHIINFHSKLSGMCCEMIARWCNEGRPFKMCNNQLEKGCLPSYLYGFSLP